MRRNRRRINFNEDTETKKLIYISIAAVLIAIITFVVTYFVYSNAISKNQAADLSKIAELSNVQNEQSFQASSSIGKTVNEVSKEQNNEDANEIAINTSNIENEDEEIDEQEVNENVNNSAKETTAEVKESRKEESLPDPTFIKPAEGEIIREFANDNLVYSETLKEWITHTGIDIKAEKTSIVKAASDGTVKSIKNDPRYGITVVIEHVNGFKSIYSNLLTAEFVKEGENVKQGQTIGTVGNTATFEILDDSHLHFELLKDNQYLNPSDYIK